MSLPWLTLLSPTCCYFHDRYENQIAIVPKLWLVYSLVSGCVLLTEYNNYRFTFTGQMSRGRLTRNPCSTLHVTRTCQLFPFSVTQIRHWFTDFLLQPMILVYSELFFQKKKIIFSFSKNVVKRKSIKSKSMSKSWSIVIVLELISLLYKYLNQFKGQWKIFKFY